MTYPTFFPPSSKSYSHRYLFGAFLSKSSVYLDSISQCDDIYATQEALSRLGLSIQGNIYSGEHTVLTIQQIAQQYELNAYGSATLSRFLSSILALLPPERCSVIITGNEQLQQRSHAHVDYYASLLNMSVEYLSNTGYLPYRLIPHGIMLPRHIVLPTEQSSSQYISGLLFTLSLASTPHTLSLAPNTLPSFPYICSTLFTLQQYGLSYTCRLIPHRDALSQDITPYALATTYTHYPQCSVHIDITPSRYTQLKHSIPSDFSAISYLLCFGILGTQPIAISYTGGKAPQADRNIVTFLQAMGARIDDTGDFLIAYPSRDRLHAIDIDMRACPDLFPTIAIVEAFAQGSATISHIKHLRTKESNRVHAMLTGLHALGFHVHESDDAVYIGERHYIPSHTIALSSYNDHRIAMAFSLCNIIAPHTCTLDDYECVHKSFPHYWDYFRSLYPFVL